VDSVAIGETVTYRCNLGYYITGEPGNEETTVRCINRNNEGAWNRQPPTCEGNTIKNNLWFITFR